MAQQVRDEIPTPDNSTNFNVAAGSETPVGTTLENLKAAVGGETGASAHYGVYADAAEKAGVTTAYMDPEETQKLLNDQYTFCTDVSSKLWNE